MISYATVGTNDLDRAKAFYDAVLAPLGARRTLTYERSQYYGGPDRGAMLGVVLPFDREAATGGNGAMVALTAASASQVDQVQAAATIVPATLLGQQAHTGSIKVGKAADLALVEGDPSVHIGDLRQTRVAMLDGKLLDADTLRTAAGFSGRPK
jgi:cytosine/adenosine deaminase-related metal-dependent hydrolase